MSEPARQRLVFAGTPAFAAHHLQALIAGVGAPIAVYTQPDRPAGRGRKLRASPVKLLAEQAHIPVCQPHSLHEPEAQQTLADGHPDVLVVVAYGLMLPAPVLDIPRLGCINVHPSLLPRWRGAAPVQRAIEAGDSETGVSIMQMAAGLDSGPVLARSRCPVGADSSAAELLDSLAEQGARLLLQVLPELEARIAGAAPQDATKATYAHKIDSAEARLDWQQEAALLARQVRAFNPFPVSWTTLDGLRLKVWCAQPCAASGRPGQILRLDGAGMVVACGRDGLCLRRVQVAGGKAVAAAELSQSRRPLFAVGRQLGE